MGQGDPLTQYENNIYKVYVSFWRWSLDHTNTSEGDDKNNNYNHIHTIIVEIVECRSIVVAAEVVVVVVVAEVVLVTGVVVVPAAE